MLTFSISSTTIIAKKNINIFFFVLYSFVIYFKNSNHDFSMCNRRTVNDFNFLLYFCFRCCWAYNIWIDVRALLSFFYIFPCYLRENYNLHLLFFPCPAFISNFFLIKFHYLEIVWIFKNNNDNDDDDDKIIMKKRHTIIHSKETSVYEDFQFFLTLTCVALVRCVNKASTQTNRLLKNKTK